MARPARTALRNVVLVCDAEGRVADASGAVFEVFGIAPEDARGRPLAALVAADGPSLAPMLDGAAAEGPLHSVLARASGDSIELETRISTLSLGSRRALVATISDVTEIRRREREIERLIDELMRSKAALENFAFAAAHDLQEPLRMIASFLQLLRKRYGGTLAPEADEFIRFAVDGARHMKALVDDLAAYAHLSLPAKRLSPTDSDAVLRRALANLAVEISDASAEIASGPLPEVMADAGQLVRVFQHLIDNAIKFRGDAPPRIHISAAPRGTHWLFSVRDNGIGIAPEHHRRIFRMFARLHTKTAKPGSGIGLTVCRDAIEAHGGEIWVESAPGQGSTFYFTLLDGSQGCAGDADLQAYFAARVSSRAGE